MVAATLTRSVSQTSLPLLVVGILIAAMIGGFLAKRFLAPDRTVGTSLRLTTESQSADSELLFVFIATSTCAGINDPALASALRKVRDYLREQAARDGQRFVTLGISLDTDTRIGQRLLGACAPEAQRT